MKLFIVGQGGHSQVIRDIISSNKNYQIIGYLDDKYPFLCKKDKWMVGPIMAAKKIVENVSDIKFVIGIGNNHIRKLVFQRLGLENEYYATLIHSSAVISPSTTIGPGTVIMPTAVVNANAQIGAHSIINTGAIIEHDNDIGDFSHISPNATLTGNVHIKEGVHVGASATVIPNVSIGEWSVIGAGATVIHHIPARCKAVGVPAQVKGKEGERSGQQ